MTAHHWESIPPELRALPWLIAGPDEKGEMKRPMSVDARGNLHPGSVTNAATWLDFERARELASQHGYGVGAVLTAHDPYVVIDLDVKGAHNEPDASKWTPPERIDGYRQMGEEADSYVEWSQSGKGLHIWVEATLVSGAKGPGVELYADKRFIVCTGNTLFDKPIANRQGLVDQVLTWIRASQATLAPPAELEERPEVEPDASIWKRAQAADNGQKFTELCQGDWTTLGYPSQSEADMALLGMLAFYSPSNEQCRRMFRQTELGKRDKAAASDRYLDHTLKRLRGSQVAEAERITAVKNSLVLTPLRPKQVALTTANEKPTHHRVSIADIFTAPSPQLRFLIEGLLPEGEVTLLVADGGVGKSFLALIAAVCSAMGLEFFGQRVHPSKTMFFSAEDSTPILRNRLAKICRHLGIDPASLHERLWVTDSTDFPCLFEETRDKDAGKVLGTTRGFSYLERDATGWGAEVIVIDNASDTFDANENVRVDVRSFMQALKRLAKRRGAAVLLLAHLDKTSVRGAGGAAKFSGSTAWHNSARSRLLLERKEDGTLTLSQAKTNHGTITHDIHLAWTTDGMLEAASSPEPTGDPAETLNVVLGLIKECYERGQWISTSLAANASSGAFAVLNGHPSYPKTCSKKSLESLLRGAQRDGKLIAEQYKTQQRHTGERWKVT